jgi:hypothetical protein
MRDAYRIRVTVYFPSARYATRNMPTDSSSGLVIVITTVADIDSVTNSFAQGKLELAVDFSRIVDAPPSRFGIAKDRASIWTFLLDAL